MWVALSKQEPGTDTTGLLIDGDVPSAEVIAGSHSGLG